MKQDQAGRKRVGEALSLLFDGLKTYGKEPEQVEAATKLFMFALADYPADKIAEAFARFVCWSPEFPAPSDIVQIIERGGKPPFDRAVYVNFTRKHPADRKSEEWEYIRDYEKFMLNG